ncbi:exosortase [Nitratidesulfovibrio sp. SRB-5]|uniref:exosortase n=1 Tax=Nitratidesulfovibrio sp. SRB-5 TaxID=2872636 RepID=UPI001025104E|nr:exosortase [Nitratidesulfovibrio sp. SRB-5]MBZ2172995.1 exosortase [Nitratidesulfovibrio sp. SRB-5]RXF78471.1 exosortase [Desulfovibrio sp. DS-1]
MTLAAVLRQHPLHFVPVLAMFAVVYHAIVMRMVGDWSFDPNYSHGFLVPCLSAWFAWRRWPQLREAVVVPSLWGLPLLGLGLVLLLFGSVTLELFTSRASLVVLLAGTILYLYGTGVFRLLRFPLAYLLFMVPLPYTVYDALALPLKGLVSAVATGGIRLMGLPVLREGNVIIFPNITLEVVDACSGLRSLMSLAALGTAFAFLFLPAGWRRWVLVLATVPIAVAANTLRVFVTGVLSWYMGAGAASGFFHEFEGIVVFLVAMALTGGLGIALGRGHQDQRGKE